MATFCRCLQPAPILHSFIALDMSEYMSFLPFWQGEGSIADGMRPGPYIYYDSFNLLDTKYIVGTLLINTFTNILYNAGGNVHND